MFNNIIFCEINIKKVIHYGGSGRNWGTVLISSWRVITVFTCISRYITWISKQYPPFMPSIGSLCVGSFYWFIFHHKTALLKSDVFRHAKDYSSQSFGPIRMGVGSFRIWMKWVSKTVSTDLFSGKYFLNKFINFFFFY